MIALAILFFVTAIIYSSVGFGGGSTYLALLLIWGVPYYVFPVIALLCNIIVVSGNCLNYIKAGNLNFKLLTPFLVGSIPFAYLGGTIPVEKKYFEILLFVVLSIAGILLLFNFKIYDDNNKNYRKLSKTLSVVIGSIIGLISGIIGIGGGIFLSPILFLTRSVRPKYIVTATSFFILVNSIFGAAGQLSKNVVFNELLNYWYLLLVVLAGGQIGNFLNLKIFNSRTLALITALVVIFVSIRMGIRFF